MFYMEILFVILVSSVLFLYVYLRYHYNYWTRQGIPQTDNVSLLVGNLGPLLQMQQSSAHLIQDIYQHPKAKQQPIVGIYLFYKRALLIRDPSIIKRILVKDFHYFSDRFSHSDEIGDPLGSLNLFFLKNPTWREIRHKLTPFFTGGRLKQMLYLIEEIGRNLNEYLLKIPVNDRNCFQLELKELCALYTTDVISTVAFGIQANSFSERKGGEFRYHGREIFRFSVRRALDFSVVFFLPHLVRYFGIKVVPNEQTEFLRSTMNYVIKEREQNGQKRNDLIDILIELRKWSKNNQEEIIDTKAKGGGGGGILFDGDLMVAQAAIFFTAGFESSSATMSFALYELARNPNIQNKLREEIAIVLQSNNGVINQNSIDRLVYMQMIIDETLRMYPPLPFLDRHCNTTESKLDAFNYPLTPEHNYSIPHGMPVYIPVYAIHMDPQYYPDPYKFEPERFSVERKKLIKPYTYMPFGLGPRGCIGERFAMLQTKIGLVNFLRNHRVSLMENDQNNNRSKFSAVKDPINLHNPLKLNPRALILQSEDGIHLNIERVPL